MGWDAHDTSSQSRRAAAVDSAPFLAWGLGGPRLSEGIGRREGGGGGGGCGDGGGGGGGGEGAGAGYKFVITLSDPVKHGDNMMGYTLYRVSTKTTAPDYQFGGDAFVLRRYSDFEWLHLSLRTKLPGVFVARLPPPASLPPAPAPAAALFTAQAPNPYETRMRRL